MKRRYCYHLVVDYGMHCYWNRVSLFFYDCSLPRLQCLLVKEQHVILFIRLQLYIMLWNVHKFKTIPALTFVIAAINSLSLTSVPPPHPPGLLKLTRKKLQFVRLLSRDRANHTDFNKALARECLTKHLLREYE